jgi:hypothetical protein
VVQISAMVHPDKCADPRARQAFEGAEGTCTGRTCAVHSHVFSRLMQK